MLPFEKIDTDIIECKILSYLIVVGNYSRWIEPNKMLNNTALEVIIIILPMGFPEQW